MGKFVQSPNGIYTIAEDVGTTPQDMAILRAENPFVTDLSDGAPRPPQRGASGVYAGALWARRFEVCPRRGTGDSKCRLALGAQPQRCRPYPVGQ
jgi:hypothetical protein